MTKTAIELLLEDFSIPAHDLFKIATQLGNFDDKELMQEINKGRDTTRKVNERSVIRALDIISRRWEIKE